MTALIPAPVWRIIDGQTGQQVGTNYLNRIRARRRADRLDLEYGAIRYRVEQIRAYLPAATDERGTLTDITC